MLTVTIPETELYNSKTEEFITVRKQDLQLEHSLKSVMAWEQRWHSRFFDDARKSPEQILDYIRCMTIGSKPPAYVYKAIPEQEAKRIKEYIEDPMSATTFFDAADYYGDSDSKSNNKNENLSAEVIYYMMFQRGIPIECEKWHINTLFALIRVYNYYAEKQKNESKQTKNGKRQSATKADLELRNRIHEARKGERLKNQQIKE